ncbi:D-alanyl-D-alanine carboxypeptidase (penicillin-binding protein 5/6) [Anaerobacterium chartisolvens]|uniref:serine-type D-Ala-D-Ala carboxypeptidase n=1 Tax=Anaerobacterium chartisolvens TaxID=1297424 RepID=A0A369BBY9_9FIRM|nr:D-alanyl-D-alanine carboxypeptidase family protein [Anaerobacterium chartisolvens]RCX17174.1 D-alanyl-D-alanine carboxypeptidase (penicillin-binding protein 5/6) [Anaerobacterium chartisolvens]
MRKKLLCIAEVLLIINFMLPLNCVADDIYEDARDVRLVSSGESPGAGLKPPRVDALSAIVLDMKSGRVLYEKNSYTKRAMASTTKIMTAIVAIENGSLDDKVAVSKRAAAIHGSTIHLSEGEKLPLRELLYGLLLNSGNDAAIAVAEHIGGSVENFCEMMNEKAEILGARNTCFKSPHGLDSPEHYSTAYDMAIITRYALENPVFSKIVGTKKAEITGHSLYNTNELLGFLPGVDGVKTGYTGQAGRCLVASATRDGRRIISVVLGCNTRTARAQSSQNMLEYAFTNYKPYRLLEYEEKITDILVIKGVKSYVSIRAVDEIAYPLTQSEKDRLVREVDLPESFRAPVMKDIEVGSIRYLLDEKVIGESSLKTGSDIRKKGFWDYFAQILKTWVGLPHGLEA